MASDCLFVCLFLQAADTEDQDSEGLLDFCEFVSFFKSISTRRELYLLHLMYVGMSDCYLIDTQVTELRYLTLHRMQLTIIKKTIRFSCSSSKCSQRIKEKETRGGTEG